MELAVLILCIAVLGLVQFRQTFNNLQVPWNGCGAVVNVVKRTAQAPMAYRVLVPWLIHGIARLAKRKMELRQWYWNLRDTLMALALIGAAHVYGWQPVPLLAFTLAMVALQQYDYWDCWVEIAALCCALTGNPLVAGVGIVAHALSRENWPLTAICYVLVSRSYASGAAILLVGAAAFVAMRLYVGRKERYCKLLGLSQIVTLKKVGRWLQTPGWRFMWEPLGVLLLLAGAAMFFCGQWLPSPFAETRIIPAMICGSGAVFGRVQEPRVVGASALWIAALLME
jgi:hypothetical protein